MFYCFQCTLFENVDVVMFGAQGKGEMQFGKAVAARAMQQDDAFCEGEFLSLIERLEAFPDSERGRLAIALAALLVEHSAFELAGRRHSREIGELIELAARLAAHAEDLACAPPHLGRTTRRALQ